LCAELSKQHVKKQGVRFDHNFAKKASPMALNKKQKKQLDVERKKLSKLQQVLTSARKQTDEPDEVARVEREIDACRKRIEEIQDE